MQHEYLRFAALESLLGLLQVENAMLLDGGLQSFDFVFLRAGGKKRFNGVKVEFVDVATVNLVVKARADIVAQD